jgi:chromosomal replication initiator protein
MPTVEEKVAILKRKTDGMGQLLSDDVAYHIAQQPIHNVRELEGVLIRLFAFASLTNQPINIELVKKVIQRPHAIISKQTISLEEIAEKVAQTYQLSVTQLRTRSRNKNLAHARQITMFLMKKLSDSSLQDIGDFLRRKDHSTVSHAITKIEQLSRTDAHVQSIIESIEQSFGR